jgi:hypothetical protein
VTVSAGRRRARAIHDSGANTLLYGRRDGDSSEDNVLSLPFSTFGAWDFCDRLNGGFGQGCDAHRRWVSSRLLCTPECQAHGRGERRFLAACRLVQCASTFPDLAWPHSAAGLCPLAIGGSRPRSCRTERLLAGLVSDRSATAVDDARLHCAAFRQRLKYPRHWWAALDQRWPG